MAVMKLRTTVKNSVLTPLNDAISAGVNPGVLKLYTGTMRATPETAITTQTLLGTLTFSDPAGVVADGVLIMSAITQDAAADATGTATWATVEDSNGLSVFDIDVTNTGGGGTLQLNTVNIVAGGPILVTSFVINVT